MPHAELEVVSLVELVEADASNEPATGAVDPSQAMNAILTAVCEGIAVLEPGGRCVVFNPQMAAITGHTRTEAERPGLFARLFPERAPRAEAIANLARAWRGEDFVEQPCCIVRKDGCPRELLISTRLVGEHGARCLLVTARDITEQRQEAERWAVERRLREVERRESLAAMAGGMAHDFNNLLQTILGFTELAAAGLAADAEAGAALAQVSAAGQRAAELTRKMLAYAGRARFVPRALDVSQLVVRARPLLAGSLTGTQWLEVELAEDLPEIDGDAAQLRQLLINLVANASEALGERGGRVVVRTGAIDCEATYLEGCHAGHGLPGGRHVFLEVEDSGCGLSEAARVRLFDPFFSTKFTGRGLGLAAVLGVVRGHRGAIDVRSAVGVGTRMRVLLPIAIGRP
jgi:PAS domain S-box-containing protein